MDNAATLVGARGPTHQVERVERRRREEEVCCPWRGSGWGYIVQLVDGESGMRRPLPPKLVRTIPQRAGISPYTAGGGERQMDGAGELLLAPAN